MGPSTKAHGKIIKEVEKDCLSQLRVAGMMVSGKKIRCMVRGPKQRQTAKYI
jgi:Tfp pilus assembly protein PilP